MPSIYLDLKLQAHRSGVYECLLFIIVLEKKLLYVQQFNN